MRITVPAVGPKEANLALVGQAPASEEVRLGVPFVGASGKQLDSCLRQAGIPREKVYITNVFDYRLSPGETIHTVPCSESEQAIARLREELQSLPNLNCIVPLGDDALYVLTGLTGITKWRGSVVESTLLPGKKVIPSVHPAWIIRGQWAFRAVLAFDLAKAWEDAAFPELRLPKHTYIVGPSLDQTIGALEGYGDSLGEVIAFDIEMYARQFVACIGLYNGISPAICIPFVYGDGVPVWSDEEEAAIRCALSRVMSGKSRKVAQNASFDVIHLARENIVVKNLWMDTLTAHHCLFPELPHSLPFLSSIYTREPYYKDEGKHWHPSMDNEQLWRYNIKDVLVTHEIALKLHNELVSHGLWGFYQRAYIDLFAPAVRMEWQGVKIDVEARKEVDDELSSAAEALEKKIEKSAGFRLNVRSPVQLKNFLYEKRGYKERYNRKTGRPTSGEDALKAIARAYGDPIVTDIIELRRTYDLLSDVIRQPLDDDNRIHCHYSQAGTETGRWSSSGSVLGTGTNLQNVPREGPARRLFIPDSPDMVFLEADLVQAEVMFVAWYAPVPGLVRLFQAGGDVHLEVARTICQTVRELNINTGGLFMMDPSDVTDTSVERYVAKRTVHASNYGMGPVRFSEVVGVPRAVADIVRGIYLNKLFPEIVSVYQQGIKDTLRRTKTLTVPEPFGWRRQFFSIWSDELLRAAYAFIPQSTVALLLNRILSHVERPLLDMGCAVRLQNHDAFLVQCRESQVGEIMEMIDKASDIPLYLRGGTLRIPMAYKVGRNWGELKKVRS